MEIFDAHINLTHDGRWFGTNIDASVDRALREMDVAGISKAGVIVPPGRDNRRFSAELMDKRADRFFVGFTLSTLDDDELATLVEWLHDRTVSFVKIHPRWLGVPPNAPALMPFLQVCADAGVAVIFCTMMRGGPGLSIRDLDVLYYDELAQHLPTLNIVLGHAGSYRVLDALAVAQSNENVFLDVSHALKYFRGSSVEQDLNFAMNKIDNRLIYGSDFPEYSMVDYLTMTRQIVDTFNDFNLEGFFSKTASNVYGLADGSNG